MKHDIIDTKEGQIVMPVPECYKDVFELIRSNQYRLYHSEVSTQDVIDAIASRDLLAWFRLCQIKDRWSKYKERIYNRICIQHLVDLPIKTRVGYGFYIGHGMCMVINGDTIIGNNVNVSQFLNIGSNKGTPATICDESYIAPHVCLVEDVTIGFNAIVGAGAVVTHDVPSNKTVAGVPAKIIKDKGTIRTESYPVPKP